MRSIGFGVFAMFLMLQPMAVGWAQTPAPIPAVVQKPAPTTSDLGALPTILAPHISPDGKRIASRGLIKGETYLLISDLAQSGVATISIPPPKGYKLEWHRWAGSNRLLISVSQMTHFEGEEVRYTRLVALDIDTNQVRFIGIRNQGFIGDSVIYGDPEGRFILLSTQRTIWEYPSVYQIDLATNKSTRVVPSQPYIWDWYADGAGVVRVGSGIKDGNMQFLYRSSPTAPFKRLVRTAGGIDRDVESFQPIAGSDKGFAVAAGPTGHFALYRHDFLTGARGELVYENPTVDIDDYDISPAGEVRATSYTDDRPATLWFDPALKKLQARIDKVMPHHVNRIISIDRARNPFIIWSTSADDPGVFFLYDHGRNEMKLLATPYATLVDKRLAAMEPVRYAARDGLEIRAYLTLPPGREAKALPLVILPHGGPFARDDWGYDAWVQFLANRGYAVLQPNFRGSTGFGRAFVEKGNGAWGRGMQDDIDDGVKWLAGRGTVDARRVCIMGASFGGYAAMWAAVRNPEIYRCAISFAGLSDVASMLRYDSKLFSAPRYFRDWRERVRGDKSFALDSISPIKSVERMTVPILIAHGSADDNVPLYQSRRLHEALTKIGRKHEYVVYEGEGHGFENPVNSTDFLNRVGRFLDAHNPP